MAEGPEVNVVEGYVKQIADVILQELSVSN
jgi:phosphoglucosamine mutase